MTLEKPTWLTEELIRKAIEDKDHCDNVRVCNMKVSKIIANDNLCDIFRVTVQYKIAEGAARTTSFIIKAPKGGSLSNLVLDTGIMKKEIRVYEEYLKKVSKFLSEEDFVNSYHSIEENVLILDDLNFAGFVMADRTTRLDFDESVLAIKALARFHAASVKVHDEEPEFVEEIGRELFFVKNGPALNDSFEKSMKIMFKLLGEKLKFSEDFNKYADHLERYSRNLWEFVIKAIELNKQEFNVLNHGDFWVNNLLFKYGAKSGKAVSVKLIDFQTARYTSPAADLLYFLNGSVKEPIRCYKSIELITIYLDELNRNLDHFNCSRKLNKTELMRHLREREFYGIFTSVSILPIFMLDPSDCKKQNLDYFTSENDINESPLRIYYDNEKYVKLVLERLVEYEKKGWF